ncbi:MAG: hypothetical protein H6R19_2481 [Proteobacteria bacterium]|nr:hypothetical protein [Pseudomonadota bacterium]
MSQIFGLVFLLLIFFLFASVLAKKKGQGNWPYRACRLVLSEPEQILYWRLDEALPNLIVLGQVGLSRVVEVPKRTSGYMSWHNKISRKSLDFVICRKDGSPLVGIELDDGSHRAQSRQNADADKTRILEAAGLPLIRWNVRAIPSIDEIKREIAKILVQQQAEHQGEHVASPRSRQNLIQSRIDR